MEEQQAAQEKLIALSREVLKLARNTLVINFRFMDSAISRLDWVPEFSEQMLAVDGQHIVYDPVLLLQEYLREKSAIPHAYLHMVLHCVFRHFMVSPFVFQDLWDLACDMAVEAMVLELEVNNLEMGCDGQRQVALRAMEKKTGKLTAEKIYHYLKSSTPDEGELKRLQKLFQADSHDNWYTFTAEIQVNTKAGGTGSRAENENQATGGGGSTADGNMDGTAVASREALAQDWKDVSERMQLDLETFSKEQGDTAGSMVQNLRSVNREKYDYTAFLKKFAVTGEAMKVNDDEFDYIFYTYGMQLFPEKRMPLIEPLEYKDVKRIREFVIAIDTSGSTSGELVQKFVQKTYNILKSTESFFSKINLHILQCDTVIQEDAKITSQEEFDSYLQNMTIKGLGGTDFRPVFAHVNEMLANHEFSNLRGLIYFTDGYGTFPERMPDYQTAFVFVEEEDNNITVPPWAIRLILRKEEI